jgi:transcription elongation factor GreB
MTAIRYANAAGADRVVSIVGTDEVDLNRNHTSWVSPLGRALMKSSAGDSAVLQLPDGTEYLTGAGSVLRAHFCGTVP